MTVHKEKSAFGSGPWGRAMVLCGLALLATACRPGDEPGAHVAGWTLIDPAQRHPVLVSQEPVDLSIRVAAGSNGLTPHQRSQVVDFMAAYRSAESSSNRVALQVPSGSANDVSVLKAVADLRELLRELGYDENSLAVNAYRADAQRSAPIRLSFDRHVAHAPICGQWPANVGDDPRNLPFHNFGCSNQRNLAAQIASPADLLGPRSRTAGSSERRDVAWEKWTKGESTVSKKEADERATKTN